MPIYRAIYIPRPKYRTFISRVTCRKYVQNVHIPLPWLVRHPRTWQHILPTLLITVLERTVHRVPHLPLHILPVTRKLVRAGAVRINRSRLIVNNRQIIRNSRASSIASLQYNRHQERRPTTAGLTAHRPAQPQVGTATCSAPETSSLYWGGPHKWAAPLQPPTPCKTQHDAKTKA